jgi:hypothetical protein
MTSIGRNDMRRLLLGKRSGGIGGSVVATDSVSANPDCDNGRAALRSMRGSRTYHERGPRSTLTHTGQMT